MIHAKSESLGKQKGTKRAYVRAKLQDEEKKMANMKRVKLNYISII